LASLATPMTEQMITNKEVRREGRRKRRKEVEKGDGDGEERRKKKRKKKKKSDLDDAVGLVGLLGDPYD
jgi:hypothetical protein